MSWQGKVIGAIVAFIMNQTVFSVTLGILLGHLFDINFVGFRLQRSKNHDDEVKSLFFSTTFSMMGYIAKADGQVTKLEIKIAKDVMTRMDLNPSKKKVAIAFFNQGKQKIFAADETILQFKEVCSHRPDLINKLLESLALTALANGHLVEVQNNILRKCSNTLGLSIKEYRNLLKRLRAQRPYQPQNANIAKARVGRKTKDIATRLNEAYLLLEVNAQSDDKKVKQAYHRQMIRHHPDKLISKGVPQESLNKANKRAQDIKIAYELIKNYRRSAPL